MIEISHEQKRDLFFSGAYKIVNPPSPKDVPKTTVGWLMFIDENGIWDTSSLTYLESFTPDERADFQSNLARLLPYGIPTILAALAEYQRGKAAGKPNAKAERRKAQVLTDAAQKFNEE